jgi:hypothetical protein
MRARTTCRTSALRENDPAERPIFLVGPGRCGTTLLRTMIGAHPRIAMTTETHYMKLADRYGAGRQDSPEDQEAFFTALAQNRNFRDLGLSLDEVRRRAASCEFSSVFAAILSAYAIREGKARAGEKTPGHHRYTERLLAWFPGASIVFVRRDPRASAASSLRSPWVMDQLRPPRIAAPLFRRLRRLQIARHAEAWAACAKTLRRHRGRPNVLEVSYEDLVARPEMELRRLCVGLGEDWDPRMLSERRHVPRSAAAAESTWQSWIEAHESKAAASVSTESLDRWRSELSGSDVAIVEAICEAGMMEYGYDLECGPDERRRQRRATRLISRVGAFEDRLWSAAGWGGG